MNALRDSLKNAITNIFISLQSEQQNKDKEEEQILNFSIVCAGKHASHSSQLRPIFTPTTSFISE